MAGGGGANTQLSDALNTLGGSSSNPLSNYASPNNSGPAQGFMQYQGQGAPNQPPSPPPTLSSSLSQTQYNGGPDAGGDYAPSNMGFDNSGSDGGVGGQPTQMQTPLGSGGQGGIPSAQGNKPLNMSQFSPQQGLQVQGNPTSQVVQKQQR